MRSAKSKNCLHVFRNDIAQRPEKLPSMMTRLKSPFTGLLVWTCFSCFALDMKAEDTSGEHYSAQLRDVERRLGAYLTKRVLVFRKSQIGRHHIKFDSRGCPATESGPELKACSNATLFTGLRLNPEPMLKDFRRDAFSSLDCRQILRVKLISLLSKLH